MNGQNDAARADATGFVLVAVLGGVLIVGAVAFAMLFTASLDSMAVRVRQESVVAREALEAALALTAAELHLGYGEHASGGAPPEWEEPFGPWPEYDVHAEVRAQSVPTEDGSVVVHLVARMVDEPGRQPEALLLRLEPELQVLKR